MGVKYVNGKAVYTVDKGIDLSHKAKIDKSKIQNSKSRTKALTKEYEKSRKKYKGKEKKRALPKVKNNSIAGEAAKNAREYRKKNPAKKTEKKKNKAREYLKKIKDQELTSNEKLLMQNLIRTGSPDVVRKGLKNAEKTLTTSKAKTKEYKDLNKRVAKQDEKFLNSSPAAYGFMAGSSPIPLKETIERQTGRKLNTKKAEKSIGYKAGYMGGIMAEYALTGGVARASVQKSIETGAKQLAKKSAKKAAVNVVKKGEKLPKAVKRVSSGIAADTVTGIPTNTLEAGKESMIAGKGEKGKAFARSFALNTALDVGFGGAMEALPAAVKGAKAAKASRSSYIPKETVPKESRKVYKEYVRSNDKGVTKFAEKAQAGELSKRASYKLSDVTADEVERLKELTGIDTTGYTHSLKASTIDEHIMKRHGAEGSADRSMADINDLSRINYIIKNADNVEIAKKADDTADLSREFFNTDGSGAKKVKYTKKIDGHYYVVEAVPDSGKKKMQIVSAYIEKPETGKVVGNQKKTAHQVGDVLNAPPLTSETGLDVTVNNSIPHVKAASKSIPEEMPDARKFMSPETQERVFDAVSKRSGAKIEFADLPEGVDGVYKNGVIKISNNAQNPAYTVMKHELTHSIESSGHYEAFADFVEKNLRERGIDVDGAVKEIIDGYKLVGKELTEAEAKKEFTAKFAGEFLFNSEKSIERLARENPSLFRQVYEWIVDTIHKLGSSPDTRFLIVAQRKYEKALRTAKASADDTEKYFALIGQRPDGIEVYKTGDDVMNMSQKERAKEFLDKMKRDFYGRTAKFEKNGKVYYARFEEGDVRKNIYGDKRSDTKGLKAKIRAGADGDIFDLVENAKYDRTSIEKGKTNKSHTDVKSWDYYVKTVQIDNKVYDEVINVRLKQDGEYVYNVSLRENKKTAPAAYQAPAYNGKTRMATLETGRNRTVNDSIPESLPSVKSGRLDRKAKQLEIIRNSNKMTDDYHVGIRDADDIKTFEEAMKDSESFFYGDFSLKDARKALKEGKVTVYSSKPIEQGGFVSTSKNMAKDYAGGGEVYSRRVGLDDVAWINGDEGQYAKVSLSAGSRLKDDTGVLDSLRKVSENLYGEKGNRYLPDARNIKMVEADNALPRVAHAEKTKVKGEAKAARYERRSVRTFDRTVKEALDISRYGDNRKIKQLTDEAVKKMKSGYLTSEDKDKLFDTIFEEGINVDMTFLEKYKHLKDELRSKPLKVTDSIRKDIADFNAFRKGNMGTLRLSKEGRDIETEYLELRSMYPELFPEKNTPAEMLEELSGVMKSIKATETKISKLYSNEEADAFIKYSRERFDAALNELDKEIHIVKRYMKKPELYSREELNSTVYDINRFRREADKVKRDNLLTDEDRGFVDMLHAGKLRPENVERFSPNSKGVLAVYNAEKKVKDAERPLKDIGERTRAYYEDLADKALEGSDSFKDKKSGWRYNRETAERNIIDIAGKENGEEINRIYFTEVHNSEALATELKNGLRNEIKKLKISTKPVYDIRGKDSFSMRMRNMTGGKKKLSESSLVQLCGEGKLPEEELELFLERFGDPARKVELREKIEQSVETFRRIYDDLFHYMNQELIRNGYPPMEYRKNYFPHFEESRPDGLLAKIGSKLGFDVRADELPTDIAGLTHTFRPGKKWFAHALSRTADVTEYDALKGFDMYLEGAADIICHTENIQKLRAFENAMRYKYSDQAVKDEVYRLRKKFINGEIGSFEYHTLVDKVYETRDKTKLANLATWTRRYTDNLAGKKSIDDRSYEYSMGRIMYDVTKAAEGQLAANMVAVNPASWLTNFIPLVQGGNVSPANVLKGMAQTVQNRIRRDGLDELSIFLTNRKGSDVLWKSRTEKWQDFLTKPMKMIDEFTSEALFRAKYHDEVAKGASQLEAVRAADRFAADVIADRSKGALPIAFNSKNPVKKIFTMFQVEVNNQWSHLMKDIPRNSENVAAVAFAFTNFFVASYIFNDVYERFIGRRPALDPIGWANDFMGDVTGRKVPNLWDAAVTAAKGDRVMLEYVDQDTAAEVNLAKNVVKDIPFVGGFLEGGRLPISSALPDMWTTGKAVGKYFREDDSKKKALSQIGREMIKPAAYLLPPVGGGQAKKIYEAGRTFAGQGDYGLDKDGEQQLKFAADRNAGNVIKGALFGKYAMGSGQEYIDSGFKMLSAKKTAAFKEAVEAGMKPSEAEQFIRSLSDDAETARNYIYKSDLTDSQKNAVGKAIQKNDKKIDYSNETSYKYSLLNKQQKEKVDELRDKGFTKESALKIREAVKGHSSQMAQVMALAGTGYDTPEVYAALGIKRGRNGNGPREKAEVLTSYGLSIDDFDTVKEAADRNGSGNVSIEEAMRYLDGTDYGRKECYALTFAMTGCKHGNNPYR